MQVAEAESGDLVKSLEECNLGVIRCTKRGLSYEIPSWWDLEEEEEEELNQVTALYSFHVYTIANTT